MPSDVGLLRFIEEKLMERFNVSTHSELEMVLEEAYQRDPKSLKGLLQEIILYYKLQKKRIPTREKKEVETYVV